MIFIHSCACGIRDWSCAKSNSYKVTRNGSHKKVQIDRKCKAIAPQVFVKPHSI